MSQLLRIHACFFFPSLSQRKEKKSKKKKKGGGGAGEREEREKETRRRGEKEGNKVPVCGIKLMDAHSVNMFSHSKF